MRLRLFFASLPLLLLVACGDSSHSVSLKTASETLFTCDKATVEDLSPAGGGYKFVCQTAKPAAQLYLIQDTSKRKDGTITELTVMADGSTRSLKPAIAATEGGPACDWAAGLGRKSGEAPVPKGQHGKFVLAMAEPCGEVTLEIGDAKP